jgi:two-component system response regulator
MEQKKIILLVEDNKQDEILTVRVLQQNGLRSEIVICRDGAEALDWIFNKGSHIDRDSTLVPHVVLLDLKLPKVNGHEVLAAIRANRQTKHLPVVILTTSKQESDIARSYQGGANSYVQKPVRFEEFSEVIQRLGVYWCATNIPASDAGPERNF